MYVLDNVLMYFYYFHMACKQHAISLHASVYPFLGAYSSIPDLLRKEDLIVY
jgi:hypothetical protein